MLSFLLFLNLDYLCCHHKTFFANYAVRYNVASLNLLVAFTIFSVLFLMYLDKCYNILILVIYCILVMEMIVGLSVIYRILYWCIPGLIYGSE